MDYSGLTETELCMLEQLTYLDGYVAQAAGISGFSGIKSGFEGHTIEEILKQFDDDALNKLEKMGQLDVGVVPTTAKLFMQGQSDLKPQNCHMSCGEWAGIIRYLKNSELKDLVLTETMSNPKDVDDVVALCFSDGGDSEKAVVAFKGTANGEEWVDNVQGLNQADTEDQKEALDFIERLSYSRITVTGHSKGGNKAMYVSVLSDKIEHCVSFDGQGFSNEFIEKYWAEIDGKTDKIWNYSLATDFVHVLMFQIPGINNVYCQGYGVHNVAENHASNSFFVAGINGMIMTGEDGKPMFKIKGDEDPNVAKIRDFVGFVMNNASDSDKRVVVGFLSELLSGPFLEDSDWIVNQIQENPYAVSYVLAYLVKYMDEYNYSSSDIKQLLIALGLKDDTTQNNNSILSWASVSVHEVVSQSYEKGKLEAILYLIDFVKEQLTDGEPDPNIKKMIYALSPIIGAEWAGYLLTLWPAVEGKYEKIGVSGGCSAPTLKKGKVRDFSQSVYDTVRGAIDGMELVQWDMINTTNSWTSYATEKWYSELSAGNVISRVENYFSRIRESNMFTKHELNRIFDEVMQLDMECSRQIKFQQMTSLVGDNLVSDILSYVGVSKNS